MTEDGVLIDLTEVRLRQAIDDAPGAVQEKIAAALLELYRKGDVQVTMRAGEMYYSLREGLEEGLSEAIEGASTDGLCEP